jgi:hypothetical protein
MKIRPRHLAAFQYAVLAVFLAAVWHALLTPLDLAAEKLKFALQDERTKLLHLYLAIATIGAVVLSALFFIRQAETRKFAAVLAVSSIAFFGLALWYFSETLIIGFGVATILAIWVWKTSGPQFDTDATHR